MRLRLFPTLAAPSEARRGLAPLAAELGDGRFADLRTVVSELVAISVTHGATTPIDLSLTLGEGAIEGSIDDEGPGARAFVRARQRREDSLPVRIVESLVDEWGTNAEQTRIWFRMLTSGEHGSRSGVRPSW